MSSPGARRRSGGQRRRWVATAAAVLVVLAACESDAPSAGTDQGTDDPTPSTSGPNTTRADAVETTTSDTSEPASTTPPPSTTPDDPATSSPDREFAAEPVRFNGVSFELPTVLDVVATGSLEPWGDAGDAVPMAIVFELGSSADQGDANRPRLEVRPVRSSNGLFYEGMTPESRGAVEQVEARIADAGGQGEGLIESLNGAGVRSIESGRYEFSGTTIDGRFVTLLDFPAEPTGETGPALDALVASLFVDAAEAAPDDSACVDDIEILENLRTPAAIVVPPGEVFAASWTIENTGTCTWTDRYAWVFTGGDPVIIEDISVIDVVEPGQQFEMTVTLRAPDEVGDYTGQFQLLGPSRFEPIGQPAFYLLEVATS
ncbi:MAG: NBR1-Ig-like domain-containing protein [Ilumatobacter sp.]|uniref:NBR1-Ig-like domain-containing protein n=1 Tax=Ilumatobacter sp. TaxID=1967498 RepID=UPI002613E7D1|nr:NBR1-Ig-like domain-containing protein [Ilumatobacter sp.]MDJ0770843.1 NBR1-Ig-like domain-containing protein [Ilumatobacter sp.]